jgi:hypothetical protein
MLSCADSMVAVPDADASSPNGAPEPEPMYLQKLWSMTSDVSLQEEERSALRAKYFDQCTKWRTFQARLITAITNLGVSEFWASMCQALREHGLCGDCGSPATVKNVVCLCHGNLGDHASLYQLSVLILILERLGVHHEKCFVFDPCHSPKEIDVLKHLGFTVLDGSDDARIRVRQMTLFYMPHGDFGLTNNLVAANVDSLHLIAVLGNNLAWVCNPEDKDTTSAAERIDRTKSRAPFVQKVLAAVKETHLQDTFASKVRSQLPRLAPRISNAFANSVCDSLDCTLSTFPPQVPLADICRALEPAYRESAL